MSGYWNPSSNFARNIVSVNYLLKNNVINPLEDFKDFLIMMGLYDLKKYEYFSDLFRSMDMNRFREYQRTMDLIPIRPIDACVRLLDRYMDEIHDMESANIKKDRSNEDEITSRIRSKVRFPMTLKRYIYSRDSDYNFMRCFYNIMLLYLKNPIIPEKMSMFIESIMNIKQFQAYVSIYNDRLIEMDYDVDRMDELGLLLDSMFNSILTERDRYKVKLLQTGNLTLLGYLINYRTVKTEREMYDPFPYEPVIQGEAYKYPVSTRKLVKNRYPNDILGTSFLEDPMPGSDYGKNLCLFPSIVYSVYPEMFKNTRAGDIVESFYEECKNYNPVYSTLPIFFPRMLRFMRNNIFYTYSPIPDDEHDVKDANEFTYIISLLLYTNVMTSLLRDNVICNYSRGNDTMVFNLLHDRHFRRLLPDKSDYLSVSDPRCINILNKYYTYYIIMKYKVK